MKLEMINHKRMCKMCIQMHAREEVYYWCLGMLLCFKIVGKYWSHLSNLIGDYVYILPDFWCLLSYRQGRPTSWWFVSVFSPVCYWSKQCEASFSLVDFNGALEMIILVWPVQHKLCIEAKEMSYCDKYCDNYCVNDCDNDCDNYCDDCDKDCVN